MIDEKRLIKECEERLLVGTNVIKMIEEQPKILEWIPLEKKKTRKWGTSSFVV